MRQENSKVRNPTVKRALEELLVPSIVMQMGRGAETGRPDTLFLIPHGRPLLIEFKWGVFKLEPKQEYWHRILMELGYDVQVHNDVNKALTAVAIEVVAAALHAARGEISARAWSRNPYARSRLEEDVHYTRSIQFLEEAGRGEKDARDRTVKSVLSSLASRGS
jgi:hypothetical protein